VKRTVTRKAGRAIGDYRMVVDGDRILVALSGGKDSWALLYVLDDLRRKAPVDFSLVAVNISPGYEGFRSDVVEAWLDDNGFDYRIERADIYEAISGMLEPGQDGFCPMCARMRRGILYRLADELGCTKIALGHHADDLIESFLMSAMYNGELRTMPPVLVSDDGNNTVIRPLCYVFEHETASYARLMGVPIIDCGCPVCGGVTQVRSRIKAMLTRLEAEEPRIKDSMLGALGNLKPDYLMDRRYMRLFAGQGDTD